MMGKNENMAQIPLDELKHLDHPVFGSLQIVRQSPKSKKTFKFEGKIHRTLEKTKSDNAIVLERQKPAMKFTRSDSFDCKFPGHRTEVAHSPSLSRESSIEDECSRRRVSHLVDELLLDIYGKWYNNGVGLRRHSSNSSAHESDSCSASWKLQLYRSSHIPSDAQQKSRLMNKSVPELVILLARLGSDVQYAGAVLARQLKRRDALISRREKQNDVITATLQAMSEKRSQDTKIRFSVMPAPGDSGFTQWHEAMKMVARLPGGIPPEFRRRLWLTLAEKHLQERAVDWKHAERFCFNEWSNPDDDELGVQIVKDLHRTGCSLFCGAAAEENQALLKRVLLAYARWNKAVGYCQGFNMLAALILQVMDRSETDSVKVMIYLIEGVLPESYFANNLRGLSVDMAVFRDLLRLRLPTLSRHLEQLQHEARDSATGTSYEPPLTNVFTMQWFLTLFSNCLPQSTVLRVWDLIFLEGNEVLLRTALAIWDGLADRIMAVESADEFYSIMGVLTREMLEFGLMDTNNLVKTIVTIAPFPFPELPELRDKYMYNITPWTQTVSTAARRGLKLFHSDDDDDEDGTDEDDEKIAVAATYGISAVFRSTRRRDSMTRAASPSSSLSTLNFTPPVSDRDRLVPVLDITALKQQYMKLRERQRQAHIIFTAACARQPLGPSAPNPVAMNHLLLGKTALLSVRGAGPPPGAVPPPRTPALKSHRGQLRLKPACDTPGGETIHWKDMKKQQRRGSQQQDDDEVIPDKEIPLIKVPESKEDDDEGDNVSDDSKSSTSTELCDEPDRMSDFDSEEPTSVSDASSYAPSVTGEHVPILMKIPSPIKSEIPTPETVSPLREDLMPERVSPLREKPMPEIVSPLKEELMPQRVSPLTEKPMPEIVSPLKEELMPQPLTEKPMPEIVSPLKDELMLKRVSPLREKPMPETVSPLKEDLIPERVSPLSEKPMPERVSPLKDELKLERVSPLREKPMPETVSPLKEDLIPERVSPLREKPMPETVSPLKEELMPQRVSPLAEKPMPGIVSPLKEELMPQRVSPLSEKPMPERVSPLQDELMPERVSPLSEKPMPERVSPLKDELMPEVVSPLSEKPMPERVSPLKDKLMPERVSPLREKPMPETVSPLKEDLMPERVSPLTELMPERISPLTEKPMPGIVSPLKEELMPQRVSPLTEKPMPESVSPLKELMPQRVSPLTEKPMPEIVSPLKDELMLKRVSPLREKPIPERVSPLKDELMPERVSPLREKPMPETVSPLKETPMPETVSPLKEELMPERVSPLREKSMPERILPLKDEHMAERISPLREKLMPETVLPLKEEPMLERVPLREEPVPKTVSPLREKPTPQIVSHLRQEVMPETVSLLREKSIPESVAPLKEDLMPERVSPLREKPMPETVSPRREEVVKIPFERQHEKLPPRKTGFESVDSSLRLEHDKIVNFSPPVNSEEEMISKTSPVPAPSSPVMKAEILKDVDSVRTTQLLEDDDDRALPELLQGMCSPQGPDNGLTSIKKSLSTHDLSVDKVQVTSVQSARSVENLCHVIPDIHVTSVNKIDYAEITDLLGLDPSLGRRNSERALQIIQENSEILQRIMQCQVRRPSKLSEEDSNCGTTTAPSEVESIPTSSSAENVDIMSSYPVSVSDNAGTSDSTSNTVTLTRVDESDFSSFSFLSQDTLTIDTRAPVSPELPTKLDHRLSLDSGNVKSTDAELSPVSTKYQSHNSALEPDSFSMCRTKESSNYSPQFKSNDLEETSYKPFISTETSGKTDLDYFDSPIITSSETKELKSRKWNDNNELKAEKPFTDSHSDDSSDLYSYAKAINIRYESSATSPSDSGTFKYSLGRSDDYSPIEVVHRTSVRQRTRPHSTIISDLSSTEYLNKSYSSSSINDSDSRSKASSPLTFRSSLNDKSSISDTSKSRRYSSFYEYDNPLKSPSIYEFERPFKTSDNIQDTSSSVKLEDCSSETPHLRYLSSKKDVLKSKISDDSHFRLPSPKRDDCVSRISENSNFRSSSPKQGEENSRTSGVFHFRHSSPARDELDSGKSDEPHFRLSSPKRDERVSRISENFHFRSLSPKQEEENFHFRHSSPSRDALDSRKSDESHFRSSSSKRDERVSKVSEIFRSLSPQQNEENFNFRNSSPSRDALDSRKCDESHFRSLSPKRDERVSRASEISHFRSSSPKQDEENSKVPGVFHFRHSSPTRDERDSGKSDESPFRSSSPKRDERVSRISENFHFRSSSPKQDEENSQVPGVFHFRHLSPTRDERDSGKPHESHFRHSSPSRDKLDSGKSDESHFKSPSPKRDERVSRISENFHFRSSSPKQDEENSKVPGVLHFRHSSPSRDELDSGKSDESQFRLPSPKRDDCVSRISENSNFRSSSPKQDEENSRTSGVFHFRYSSPSRNELDSGKSDEPHFRLPSPKRDERVSRVSENSNFRSSSPKQDEVNSKTPDVFHFRHCSPTRDEFDSRKSSESHYRHSSPRRDEYDTGKSRDTPYRHYSPKQSEFVSTKRDDSEMSSQNSLLTDLHWDLPSRKSKDINISLPAIKSNLSSPTRCKAKFDPFPPRPSVRQPKELGIKLGLYTPESRKT